MVLGLATAPVLYAAQQFPDLKDLIRRKFSRPGDVEDALNFVLKSDGLERTKLLAVQYKDEALRSVADMRDSDDKLALETIAEKIVTRIN